MQKEYTEIEVDLTNKECCEILRKKGFFKKFHDSTIYINSNSPKGYLGNVFWKKIKISKEYQFHIHNFDLVSEIDFNDTNYCRIIMSI